MVAILHNETGKVTNWQPFKSEGDAKMALLAYALHARLPHAAILWTDGNGAKLIQQGIADPDGDVHVLIAHAHGSAPPPPNPPHGGMLQSFETAAASVLASAEADASAAAKWTGDKLSAGWQATKSFVASHPQGFDRGTVAFDAIAVIGGVVGVLLLPEEITAVGVLALGAGIALLAADASHLALESMGGKYAVMAEEETHSPIFETIEWVAPFLCLPDLVMNAPKAVIAATRAAGEAGDVAAEADRAGTVLAKTQEKLTGYQQKISDRTLNAGNMAKIQRYRHQINVAARAVDALGDKLAKARTTAMASRFLVAPARIGFLGAGYGFGNMAAASPGAPGYVQSFENHAIAAWHDLGSMFTSATPALPAYPVMPDANNREFHHQLRGGYYTRVGDDPWRDMQSYLSIHLAMTRIKPR